MSKTVFLMATTAALALALAACKPPTPRHKARPEASGVVTSLDCPARQGGLERVSVAADGRSCAYSDQKGAAVALQIVNLNGADARTALQGLESELQAELPARTDKPTPAADTRVEGDDVDIDIPGVRIRADEGGRAQVQAGNVHIDANDDSAHIRVRKRVSVDKDGKTVIVEDPDGEDGVSVDADDDGAVIRMNGEGRRGSVRRTLILVSKTPGPHGYKVAGYEARGPRTGPLVVASVKAKDEDHDRLYDDMRALLKRNARN